MGENKRLVYDINWISASPFTRVIFSSSNVLHSHEFWEFSISLSGECTNTINGKNILFKEGNISLMRPEDVHNIHSFKNNHLHRDVYVRREKMKKVCDLFLPDLYEKLCSGESVINFYLTKIELDTLKKDLECLEMHQKDNTLQLDALFTSIISYIIGLWIKREHFSEALPESLSKLLAQINSGVFMHSTIKEIAESTNYSHGYLCKLFKKYLGVSLEQYVRDFKLNYSFYLLTNKDLSVIEIANALDYDVPSSFTNAFKRKFGFSPKEAKKRYLQR